MNKRIIMLLLAFLPLFAKSQDFGYFGKKNLLGFHGTWFFRAMPQFFYAEKMYRYNENSNNLTCNALRNHVWHAGLSYRRILNKSHAVGIQADYSLRHLGDPFHDKTDKVNFQADWANINVDYSNLSAFSSELGKVVRMSDVNITPTSISVIDIKAIWSRSRTSSVIPLGLTSTWGLGYQMINANFSPSMYASGFTYDDMVGEWSASRETFQLQNAPDDLVNKYWGIGWMWDLSLNYALNKSWMLSFGSDIRGTFLVKQAKSSSDMADLFLSDPNQNITVEGLVYGRNMGKEIRKELIFQNTFRLGLVFAF
jgi:hypothetical protein